jgi:UDP-2,3-diacylglucosamine hydrolase
MRIYNQQTKILSIENKTAFISDIHLDPNADSRTALFLSFIEFAHQHFDTLFILGDLFEYWVGDDDNSELAKTVLHALKMYSRKHTLYFMRGNRDFMVGKQFAKLTGATVLSDPQPALINHHQALLMHGDLLCTLDTEYLKTRRFYTNPLIKAILNQLPLSYRQKKANSLRDRSKKHFDNANSAILDVHQPSVDSMMEEHNATLLIHGHTHKPAIHQISATKNQPEKERHVLGDWYQTGNMIAVCNDELTHYTFNDVSSIKL